MAKWEYKTIYRSRGWDKDKEYPKAPWMYATDWNIDIDKTLKELGDEGWELVAVTPRSSYMGGQGGTLTKDFAGFTSDEVWVSNA
jgi:hypothetical protein